jgi:hypothetical protein
MRGFQRQLAAAPGRHCCGRLDVRQDTRGQSVSDAKRCSAAGGPLRAPSVVQMAAHSCADQLSLTSQKKTRRLARQHNEPVRGWRVSLALTVRARRLSPHRRSRTKGCVEHLDRRPDVIGLTSAHGDIAVDPLGYKRIVLLRSVSRSVASESPTCRLRIGLRKRRIAIPRTRDQPSLAPE